MAKKRPTSARTSARDADERADLTAARRVLRTEAEGLEALAGTLDGAWREALSLLATVSGRITVTGMGKSGHVARKIASTLASTGTPAQFVHPGEASHGDLGMIAPGDAVIALSNSGETEELLNIITYTRRFAIPLIAIVGRANSTLDEAADATLVLPPVPEACPMGLAPTTSTTMMMALGDAIAVALLERKGFTAADFQLLHPGGSLGRKLLRVSDIMHGVSELPLCDPETSMADAILTMTARRFGCVGVADPESGALVGIITDGDLRRNMSPRLLESRAGDVMTRAPVTVRPEILAAEALGIMNGVRGERRITSLFVVEDVRPIGILHIHDCLRAGIE